MQYIHVSEVEGKPAVCFDTGLDSRSFARTKMSQSLVEPGYVVYPNGTHETWRASGVCESDNGIRVWGTPFFGERLDKVLEEASKAGTLNAKAAQAASQKALQAVVYWIRAKMLLGDTHSTLNPGAVFICLDNAKHPQGSVFFCPSNLSNRCLYVERTKHTEKSSGMVSEKSQASDIPLLDRNNCPDLVGMEAAVFCAGVMLYCILANFHPYPNDAVIFQDMREGIFLQPHLAAPGLNKKLCSLIQSALLLPVEKRETKENGADIINQLLHLLINSENKIVSIPSLFVQLQKNESNRLEKARKNYFLKQNTYTKTRRFIVRNKLALIGTAIMLVFILFIYVNTSRSIRNRPTTEGMHSDSVVTAYYDAFSSLNHTFMEACIQGADKTDINVAINFFAVSRAGQAYDMNSTLLVIPARAWKENGGELPAPNVFGVTDLTFQRLAGNEESDMTIYRTEYLLWIPSETFAYRRRDDLTLRRDRRNNWRITEIYREELGFY